MNNTHLHLVVNHLPIIFPVVGLILLLIGIFTKTEVSKRNSYFIFILGALASIAAMATGEGAEHDVENLPGVTESLIESHEEAAEIFAALSYILGGFSAVALLSSFKKYSFAAFMPYPVVLLTLVTVYFAQRAGNTGGEIRHTEIRSAITQYDTNGNTINKSERDEDHE